MGHGCITPLEAIVERSGGSPRRGPDFIKPYALTVDASQVGVGEVLMQPDEENVNHPICHFSKKFTPAQRNYCVIEQELLAITLALQHFEIYNPAYGPRVTILDHSSLQFLNKFKLEKKNFIPLEPPTSGV